MAKETSITETVKYTTDTEDNVAVPFIDFTVCPAYESAYKEDVLQYYGLKKDDYRKNGIFYPTKNGNNIDPRLMFLNVTHDVQDIFFKIKMNTLSYDLPVYVIDFSEGNAFNNISITTKFYHHFGRCYSIHPKGDILKLGVTSIYFITKINIYVYFGYPGQFMYSNTKSKVSVIIKLRTIILFY